MRRSETSWIPIFLFALILLVHGSTLGLSDDEAYYWTLSHHFALGFAYHPPLVTWLEGLSRILLGWFIPENTSFVARVPAIACAVTTLLLAQSWVRESTRERADETKAALVLISFAGLFGLSWMIVPDLPMFVGWTLAWWASWKICFSAKDLKRAEWALAAGLLIAMLSKFSGVLCVVSAVLTVNFWAPRERKGRAMGAIFAAVVLAAAPILIWNARHHWGALIYQLRERHSDDTLSWARYARFWGAQVLTAGIAVLAFTFLLLRRARKGQDAMVSRFALAWILPGALVFCVQPLFSDFKPHWAFVVWWPVVMVLARSFALGADRWLARTQIAYGFAALALILVSCHLPLLALLGQRNPKLDVSNDLYGWREFRARVLTELGPGALDLPVVGSRYQ
ncbi:MAG: ArnT family glycosyltransferase, partial [Bdellovibrionota bacterium]